MTTTVYSEKTTAFALRPVSSKTDIAFPYYLDAVDIYQDANIAYTSYWDHRNSMILNVITHKILLHHYYGNIPRRNDHPDVIEANQFLSGGDLDLIGLKGRKYKEITADEYRQKVAERFTKIYPVIDISDKDIWLHYNSFKKCSSTEIFNFMKSTSKCGLRLNFRARRYVADQWEIYKVKIPGFMSLFSVEDIPIKVTKHKKPRFTERAYKIKFNTPLALLYYVNLVSLNLFLFPDRFNLLTKDAQFIYKRFIAHRYEYQKRTVPVSITFSDIKKFLNIADSNLSRVRVRIESALEDIVQAGLIDDKIKTSTLKTNNDLITYDITKICKN